MNKIGFNLRVVFSTDRSKAVPLFQFVFTIVSEVSYVMFAFNFLPFGASGRLFVVLMAYSEYHHFFTKTCVFKYIETFTTKLKVLR